MVTGQFLSNPSTGNQYMTTGASLTSAATSVKQSQKQTKVQSMKNQQLLMLKHQYAQYAQA